MFGSGVAVGARVATGGIDVTVSVGAGANDEGVGLAVKIGFGV